MNFHASPRASASTVLSASFAAAVVLVAVGGCSSSNDSTASAPDAATPVAEASTCASPGMPTPGAADTHCQGVMTQPVSSGSCMVSDAGACDDAKDGGGDDDDSCDYGATNFGMEADDDDCKYHVTWSSTSICEGNVTFTVKVVDKTTGQPVTTSRVDSSATDNQLLAEAYLPTQPIPACDTMDSTHPSPTAQPYLTETSPTSGEYVGTVAFDAPGEWTVRFHIQEQCADVCDDSPHGHAAFHITVP